MTPLIEAIDSRLEYATKCGCSECTQKADALSALKIAVEGLQSIGTRHTKCSECDGGEFKQEEANDTLATVAKTLGLGE